MLSSLPNVFDNTPLQRLKLSFGVHGVLLFVGLLVDIWYSSRPVLVSLRATPCPVRMARRTSSKYSQEKASGSKEARQKKVLPVKKKAVKKKAAPKKKTAKKRAAIKKEPKKSAEKSLNKEQVVPKSQEKQTPPSQKKNIMQEQVSKEINSVPEVAVSEEPVDVSAGMTASSVDVCAQEFGKHFSLPGGFDNYEPFIISFDIEDHNVINISPHTQGALVVYSAVKDALLHCRMPVKHRKQVVWHIT